MSYVLLADLINVFHMLIILFIIVAPFTNLTPLLILHITFSISLLVHWIGNNNTCSLTLMESYLRGINSTESYSHKFIAPMYDIGDTEWSNICYIIVISLMLFSIYKLYTSEIVKKKYEIYIKSNESVSFGDYIKYFFSLLEY